MNNKEFTPIMVTGPYTCGKGALISLLDSPQILTCAPWHDMLIDVFFRFTKHYESAKQEKSFRGKDDRILLLRKFLSEQDYPMLEQYALQKTMPFPISSDKYENLEFDFDFYNQSKDFFEQIYNLESDGLILKNIFNIFLQSFIDNFKNLPKENYKYFVSASEPGFCDFEELIKQLPEIKIIYIYRENWILAYAERLTKTNIKNPVDKIFKDRRLNGILTAEKSCKFLEKRYPDNFKVIDFTDLIENSVPVAKNVVNFIGLEWKETYSKPSFLCKEFESQQIVGKVLDSEENSVLVPAMKNNLISEYNKRKGNVKPIFKEIQFLQAEKPLPQIASKDISVVVQGAIEKKETKKCLKSIRKFLPDAEIILSTWEDSDISGLDYDVLVMNPDPGGVKNPATWKVNNVNRQIISTISGIKKATRKYCLKLRSDLEIIGLGFLNYFVSSAQTLKREKKYSIFKNRIVIDSYFTRNPNFNSRTQIGLCFHPSDLWHFGLKEDLENLFDIPLQEKYVEQINGFLYQYRCPEQHIWTSFLEKNDWSIYMDCSGYSTPYTKELTFKSILNNFFVLNHKETGISLPKKFKTYKKDLFTYVLDTTSYYGVYKNYYDNNFKIPNKFKFRNIKEVCKAVIDILGVTGNINEIKDLLKPFRFIIRIPYCIFAIIIKSIVNSYKVVLRVVGLCKHKD